MATRFCAAAVIKNKLPKTVITHMFTSWITIFGAPKKILSDNGCEFNNYLFREMGEGFNIKILTTAAESPFSNGICERLNGVLGNLVNKILHEAGCEIEMALAWAVSARNALDNNSGFSPNQLVFGFNPAIPDIFHNELPGLEDASKSDLLRRNLNALHIARQAFIKFESDERIRRALRHNVRPTDSSKINQGDDVHYKRNESDQWHGPATVIGKDGKQIIIKHGGYPLRVHIVRLAREPSGAKAVEMDEREGSVESENENIGTVRHEGNENTDYSSTGNATGNRLIRPQGLENSDGNQLLQPQGLKNSHIPEGINVDKEDYGRMPETARLDDEVRRLDECSDSGRLDDVVHRLQNKARLDDAVHRLGEGSVSGRLDDAVRRLQAHKDIEGLEDEVHHPKADRILDQPLGLNNTHIPSGMSKDQKVSDISMIEDIVDRPRTNLNERRLDDEVHSQNEHSSAGRIGDVIHCPNDSSNPKYVKMTHFRKGMRFKGIDPGTGKMISGKILGRAGKVTGRNKLCFNIMRDDGWIGWYNLEQLINLKEIDESCEMIILFTNEEVNTAKRRELDMWEKHEVFEEVEDNGQRSISTRWIITEKIKNEQSVIKARLVARGYEEDTEMLQTDSPTCSREAIRMLIATASSNNWCCHTVDVKSAYLQGDPIQRLLFLRPPPEFNIGKLWKLKKTVYGLADAARAWYNRVVKEFEALDVSQCELEHAMYVWHNNGKLEGIIRIYVDDFLWAGTSTFKNIIIDKLKQKFLIGSSASKCFTYLGLQINSIHDGIIVEQTDYIASLYPIPLSNVRIAQKTSTLTNAEEADYRSLVGQLNWIATQTRPDIAFDICDLSTAAHSAKVENVLKLNKVLRWAKEESLKIFFPKLASISHCSLECYTDAAFGNLAGGYSQGGYIIFLKDTLNRTCPLAWQSRKIQRAVNEIMAAETLALIDGARAAINLAFTIQQITQQDEKMKITCWVDNRNLQTSIYSSHQVENKRLRIDILTIKNMMKKKEIEEVKWVSTHNMLADVLTKRGVNKTKIRASVDKTE